MIVAYFDHKYEWILVVIGIISSRGIVIYVFVGPTKKNVNVLYYYIKENRWYSYSRNNFETRVLYHFSSNIILLNKVSGFAGNFQH